ncbi:MAG: AAA family ATPase, partial [Solobacterium sp.]|nr:AAA family ATPase [Solobacterium sp.]
MPARVMPSAPEAEASLLGTMMVYPNATRIAIEEGLSEDDFYSEANRRVFQAVQSLYQEGSPVDLTTVSTRLNDLGQLEHSGGLGYLTALADAAVTSANTKNYVRMIHDKAVIRSLIETADRISEEGMEGQPDINEYLDRAEKAVLNISRSRRTSEFRNSQQLMTDVLSNIQKMSDNHSDITGLKTGYRDLDRITHGFQKGDLIILAARPSMGKTAVALNLALHSALYEPKKAVDIFSLEMSAEQLAMRLLSAHARVPGDNLKTGYLSNEQWNKVNEAAAELRMLNLYIDDTPGVHVP